MAKQKVVRNKNKSNVSESKTDLSNTKKAKNLLWVNIIISSLFLMLFSSVLIFRLENIDSYLFLFGIFWVPFVVLFHLITLIKIRKSFNPKNMWLKLSFSAAYNLYCIFLVVLYYNISVIFGPSAELLGAVYGFYVIGLLLGVFLGVTWFLAELKMIIYEKSYFFSKHKFLLNFLLIITYILIIIFPVLRFKQYLSSLLVFFFLILFFGAGFVAMFENIIKK